jgi:multiple sugar transport system ATP-binding protein
MATLSYVHVTKQFSDGDVAVDDLSLEVADREFMVIVGPSGCGKTTMLRLLAGLETLSEGVIKIGDRVVNDVPPRNRDVSIVFQNYALYPHMSVFDNMSFGLRMQGFPAPAIEERVIRAARALGLGSLLARKPHELSGGEQQRVALGRAIVKDPQAYLFDEPLSSIDAKLRADLRVDLKRVQKGLGTTSLYVTHDQVEAMTMGDRIAVMKDGVLQQVGPPMEVYDHPANIFVAGFIGTPAMNFLPVTVSGRLAKTRAIEIELPYPAAVDRAVLGIRPEALTEHPSPSLPTIDVKVDMAERLGRDQFVYGTAGDDGIVARIDSNLKVSRGDRMRLGVDLRLVHLFDVNSGQAFM